MDARDGRTYIFKKACSWGHGTPKWIFPTKTQTRFFYDHYTKHFTINIQNDHYVSVMFLEKPIRPAFEAFDSEVHEA